MALLREDQQCGQVPAVEFGARAGKSCGIFFRLEMQRDRTARPRFSRDFLNGNLGHSSSQMSHMVNR